MSQPTTVLRCSINMRMCSCDTPLFKPAAWPQALQTGYAVVISMECTNCGGVINIPDDAKDHRRLMDCSIAMEEAANEFLRRSQS